jgi:hypothetical protein
MNSSVLILVLIVAAIIFIVIKFARIYTISVSDFKSLFIGMNDDKLRDVTVEGPNHTTFKYQIYPVESIECYDKKDNHKILKNGPGLEVRFTNLNSKKTLFYFDSIRIQGSILTGSNSRYLDSRRKTIDLNNISKIEVRNIKKGFRYASNPFN